MAVVNLKSTIITNRDATPVVLTEPSISGGVLKESSGFITSAADDSIASIYRLCQVPSNARVSSVLLSSGALTSAAADIGVYYPTTAAGTAGAVISVAYFGSAVSLATAQTNTEVLNESTTNTVAKQQQELWQAIGLSADPGGYFDVAATLTAATTAIGAVGLKVRYVQN